MNVSQSLRTLCRHAMMAMVILIIFSLITPLSSCSSDEDGSGLSNDSSLIEFHLSSRSDSLIILDYANGRLINVQRIDGTSTPSVQLRHGRHQLVFASYGGTGYIFDKKSESIKVSGGMPGSFFMKRFELDVIGTSPSPVEVQMEELTGTLVYRYANASLNVPDIRIIASEAVTELSLKDGKPQFGRLTLNYNHSSSQWWSQIVYYRVGLIVPSATENFDVDMEVVLLDQMGNVIETKQNCFVEMIRGKDCPVQSLAPVPVVN